MSLRNQDNYTPIPQQHEISRIARQNVEAQLLPCIVTRLDQGDDYGLDGYVQQLLPRPVLLRTPVIFALQIKGTAEAFDGIWQEPLEVKHLKDWSATNLEVLVAIHSTTSNATRWQFARNITSELDTRKIDWREQKTVRVSFSKSDERSGNSLHSWLKASLDDLNDREGGKSQLHRSVRKVLLTELYHEYAYVGQRGGIAERPDGPPVAHFITGLQWQKGELDERKLIAYRALCGALLLFEQVYFPSYLTYAVVGALGGKKFIELVESGRLIPIDLNNLHLFFVHGSENQGDLCFFEADSHEIRERELNSLRKKYQLSNSFVSKTLAATKIINLPLKRIEAELLEVSKSNYVRNLLGLGKPRPHSKEPIWSAERLLRIGNVVQYYMMADQLSLDVVEMEPGLARLALARWGSRIKFHRVYQALEELEATLNASALPDLGLLSSLIGTKRCIEISDSQDGQQFRSWFWQAASDALEETGAFEGEIARRIIELSGSNQPLPREFMIGVSETSTGKFEGWASRFGAEESLTRQRNFSALRMKRTLVKANFNVDEVNQPCPCENDITFGACCGRILISSNL